MKKRATLAACTQARRHIDEDMDEHQTTDEEAQPHTGTWSMQCSKDEWTTMNTHRGEHTHADERSTCRRKSTSCFQPGLSTSRSVKTKRKHITKHTHEKERRRACADERPTCRPRARCVLNPACRRNSTLSFLANRPVGVRAANEQRACYGSRDHTERGRGRRALFAVPLHRMHRVDSTSCAAAAAALMLLLLDGSLVVYALLPLIPHISIKRSNHAGIQCS